MCDSDRWPIPPYHPEDYWALLELLGPEEFERIVLRECPKNGTLYPQTALDGAAASH